MSKQCALLCVHIGFVPARSLVLPCAARVRLCSLLIHERQRHNRLSLTSRVTRIALRRTAVGRRTRILVQQVMSTNSTTAYRSDPTMSIRGWDNRGGSTNDAAARNVPLLRPGGDTPYSVWCPEMETYLMRVGVLTRDYKNEMKNWSELVATVEAEAADEETAAIQRMLGQARVGDPSATVTKKSVDKNQPLQKENDARLVAAMVNRAKRAYGIIYSALPHDIRELIADVPQGYAYGLWSLLKDRFESQSDDNIADVWTRYVSLSQESDEAFDAYMARVDKVTALLKGAGQEPQPGLRKVILLYRLQPMYSAARLALQASKRLNAANTIDWLEVKTYMLDYERDQLRGDDPMTMGERAMAARAQKDMRRDSQGGSTNGSYGSGDRSRVDMSTVKCYNCNKLGHTSRYCGKPRRKMRNEERQENVNERYRGDDESPERKYGGHSPPPESSDYSDNEMPNQRVNSAYATECLFSAIRM